MYSEKKKTGTLLDIRVVLSVFEAYGKMNIKNVDNELILFEIYNNEDKNSIVNILSPKSRIVTNKQKPLLLSVDLSKITTNLVSFYIYQKKARGGCIVINSHIDNLPKDLFQILKPIQNERNIEEITISFFSALERQKFEIEMKFYLLDIETLEKYLKGPWIGGIQEKQVVYTYNHYKNMFDKNIERIDDLKTQEKAKGKNKEVKSFLDICEKISKKYCLIYDIGELCMKIHNSLFFIYFCNIYKNL